MKLLRVTAYVNRFISLLKSRVKGTNRQVFANGLNLSAAVILRAENMWIPSVQESSFTEELKYLRSKSKASSPPNVRNLGLYVDQDDMLKCNGRLNNAPFLESEKRPSFLPSKHYFTKLTIRRVHEDVKHSGINHTLSTLRERFWVRVARMRNRETNSKRMRSMS